MISVCIATYNGERYLKEQIDSILPQLSVEDEIIISDDGSTDSTIKILQDYCDSRIKIFYHTKKEARFKFDYTTFNFENAISRANGDYIFLADQDDVWLPNKVEVMKKSLEKSDIVVSDCIIVDKDLKTIRDSLLKNKSQTHNLFQHLYRFNNPGCCIAFKKNVISTILPFPQYGVPHDFWIIAFGGLYHKVEHLNIPLIMFRRHANNVSSSAGKSSDKLEYRLSYRFTVLKAILRRAGVLRTIKCLF